MKISHKGILLISIPLACEILFVAILFQLQDGLEAAANRESRSREIISTANSILVHVNQLAANGALFGLLSDQLNQVNELGDIKSEMTKARDLMSYCPEQAKNWQLMQSHAQLARETLLSLKDAILEGERALSGESRRDLRLSLGRLFQDLQNVKDEEERRHQATRYDTEAMARRRVKLALWSGVAGNALLTGIFLSVFYRDIGRKLSVILGTVRQIGEQKKLNDPLTGTDELAELDGVLHEMHALLELARRKDYALLDNATALICSLDSQLRFLEVSKASESILGMTGASLKGVSLRELVDPDEIEPLLSLQNDSQVESSSTEVELKLCGQGGKPLYFHWSIHWSPLDSRYFCVAMDISQKKELDRIKNDFMNMISHDLRTPLTSLTMFLEMLSLGSFGTVNDAIKSGLAKSRRSLNRLIELINDLLDLEKIESGNLSLSLSPVLLLSVLSESIEMLEPLFDAHNIDLELKLDSDISVMVDQTRLLQVLQNLLSNAIKYSPQDSTIQVEAHATGSQAMIRIVDHGAGIPTELQASVFDRFRQLDTTAKKGIKGTGLGLSVCKALVELHKGEIGVISEPGHGATFWFTVPLATPRADAADVAEGANVAPIADVADAAAGADVAPTADVADGADVAPTADVADVAPVK